MPFVAKPSFDKGGIPHRFDCTVTVQTREIRCVDTPSASEGTNQARGLVPGAIKPTLLGAGRVKLRSSNVVNDTIGQFLSADVTVQDSLPSPIGTPDGTTVVGSKVIFHTGPTATAYKQPGDTGTVSMRNADGVGNYTGLNQPYFTYPGIIAPYAISAPRNWVFNVPRTVKNFTYSVYVFTASPQYLWVPETPTSGIPAGLLDSARFVSTSSGARFLPGVVQVLFNRTATAAQRDNAVASVGGVVVGGVMTYGDDGFYLVKVSDSTSLAPVYRAIDSLRAQPTVSLAEVTWAHNNQSSFLRPRFAPGWRTWALSPDTVGGGLNWGLERIAAPFAWGCSTGGTAVKIGVIDDGISPAGGPIQPNTYFANVAPSRSSKPHGAEVASIVGARGDSTATGMTGVMWNAALILADRAADPKTPGAEFPGQYDIVASEQANLIDAVTRGAQVINWSMNRPFGSTTTPSDSNRDNVEFREEAHRVLVKSLGELAAKNLHPLMVISAGNEKNYDVRWGGYPLARVEYPAQVIVVGASNRNNQPWDANDGYGGSQRGSLVDIYAPGEQVGVYQRVQNAIVPATGTSFAAPLVTGVAGLLMNFDPRVTSTEVKALIIQGSTNGGRSVDGLPLLNAYEVLKLAARRQGAPLCGNRVHSTASGDVIAERVGRADELLFTSIDGTPYTDLLNVLHGGKRIQIGDYREFKWSLTNTNASHWSQTPSSIPSGQYHDSAGGAFLSWYDGMDHDRSTYLIINNSPTQGVGVFTPQLMTASGNLFRVLSQLNYPVRQVNGAFVCSTGPADSLVTTYCPGNPDPNIGREFVGSWVITTGVMPYAFAPQGNFILHGANYRFQSHQVTNRYGSDGRLVTTEAPRDTSSSLELWKVDTASGAVPRQLRVGDAGEFARDGLSVEWLAIDETGTEFVWQIGRSVSDETNGTQTCKQRAIEYRALPGHPTVQEGRLVRPAIPLPDVVRCQSFGPATFSPYRAGSPPSPRSLLPGSRSR